MPNGRNIGQPGKVAYLPPANLEAEQSVLGAILVRPGVLDLVADRLSPGDFYREAHGRIYQAMLDLDERRQPVDLVTVTALLKERGQLEGCGGPVFMAGLSEQVGFATNAEHYAGLVADKALLRRLLDAAQEIAGQCLGPVEDVREFVDRAELRVFQVAQQVRGRAMQPLAELLASETAAVERVHRDGKLPGLSTGFRDLDRYVTWEPGDLVLLAARPSIGKTALALNFAVHAAKAGHRTAFFSLEMDRGKLLRRMMAAEARIDLHRLNRGRLTAEEWAALFQVQGALADLPLVLDDTSGLSVMELRARVRRLARDGLALVVVDYLQMMRPANDRQSREQQVSGFGEGLKNLAQEMGLPVIALSQLSRKPEERPGKKPQLSDLRDSGTLEQAADIVMFIHREKSAEPGAAEIMIEKQRNGPCGLVKFTCIPAFTKFEDHWEGKG
jgi:replicative DNA helicase